MERALGKLRTKPRRLILSQKPPKETNLTAVQKLREPEFEPVTIPRRVSPRVLAVNYSGMRSLPNRLPDVLKSKIFITDDADTNEGKDVNERKEGKEEKNGKHKRKEE